MINGDLSHQQALTAWQALRDWLVQDEAGQAVLARLQVDPHGQASALTQWLQARSGQVPPQLATYVLGGRVEKLINIAQVGVVLIQHILPPTPPTALYQLPPDIADFTGRQKELSKVTALLEQAAQAEGTAVAISAVAGMAGVGKSALATHVAHRLKDRFPDAQLHVDLRGADGQPRDPFNVLGGFLWALGVEDQFVPKELEGRVSLYRSRLANKRALVILDNAHDETQVRPLLPGSPICAVLITSRENLSALEGATIMELKVMLEGEALELLGRLAGTERVQSEHQAADTIIKLCGRLPLAIRIAGGTLRKKPHWDLEFYASQLDDERRRLDRLQLGDLNVRASLALSYRDLAPEDARLFRLIGLLAGANFVPEVAAALLDTAPETAQEGIERLVDTQLLEPAAGERYRFHDLIRLFARERLEEEEEEGSESKQNAQLRAVQWYLCASCAVDGHLSPEVRRLQGQTLAEQTGQSVQEAEQFILTSALSWFEEEKVNLLTAIEWAYDAQEWKPTCQLATHLFTPLRIRGYWAEWERTQELCLEASQKAHDRHAESVALNNLGEVYRNQGYWEKAVERYGEALSICRELGNRKTEGRILNNLGAVYTAQGHWTEAIQMFEASLHIKREEGDRPRVYSGLIGLGNVFDLQGRSEEAIEKYKEALSICRELGDHHGVCHCLGGLATVLAVQDRWEEAINKYEEVLGLFQEMRHRPGEGQTLANLGNVFKNQGRLGEAVEKYEDALGILLELGDRSGEATVLLGLGNVYLRQGSWEEAIKKHHEALSICRELGDRHGEGKILTSLGQVYTNQGLWTKAILMFEASLSIQQVLGDRYGEVQSLGGLGNLYLRQGSWEEAIKKHHEALSICRELGDHHGEGQTLADLGAIFLQLGRLAEAIDKCKEALSIFQELGDRQNRSRVLINLGSVYQQQGLWSQAVLMYEEALSICKEAEDRHAEGVILNNLGEVHRNHGRWEEAIEKYEASLQVLQELGDIRGAGTAQANLGLMYAKQGKHERAVTHWLEVCAKLPANSPEHKRVTKWLKSEW